MGRARIWGTLHPFFEAGAVFGRKEANAGFLTALLRRDPFDAYHFFIQDIPGRDHLVEVLRTRFADLWNKGRIFVGPFADLPAMLEKHSYACFHLSDWVHHFVPLSLIRNTFSHTLFPVTAPVHTLSYADYGAQLFRHVWNGVTPRDRIIATSDATRQVLEGYFEQFSHHYGLEGIPRPGLARIPLGVDPRLFATPENREAEGRDLRAKLGADNATVFLSFSRLSLTSKMDFFSMFDAFNLARGKGLDTSTCHLILAGRLDDNTMVEALIGRARECGLKCSLIAAPDQGDHALRKTLFAAADVFLSPVDNIQETFGLTILEAFTASLPVVASALNGYTELVRHEEDGFLIPTLGPASAEATTALSSMVLPDLSHFLLAQQCVVDLDAFAEALLRLGQDPALRQCMGQAGRTRALASYSWDSVIDAHLALWEDLAATPLSPAEEQRARQARHPLLPDYTRLFQGYYTATADTPNIRRQNVKSSAKGRAVLDGTQKAVLYSLLAPHLQADAIHVLLTAALDPTPFHKLAEQTTPLNPKQDRDQLLLWALKHGYLEFTEK